MNTDFFQQVYYNNTVEDYCWFSGMMLAGIVFEKYLSKLMSNLLYKLVRKYSEGVENDKFYELLHAPLSLFIYLILLYTATSHIEYPEEWGLSPVDEFGLKMVIHRLYLTFLAASITWAISKIVDFIGIVLLKKAEKTESKQDDQIIPFAVEFIKIIIYVIAIFSILGSVFNVNIASLIAGLGIGGLALALAAKESLENLLGSFTIFFDKPFVVGDMVKVGNITGTVEKVGFRSTRLRTLEKSFLTVPNKKMIDAELDNLTLRTFRRELFTIGVLYGTKAEQIKAIVEDIQKLIDEHPHTNQDGKVRFSSFGSSSLDIMVLYFVDTMDYGVFLDVKQEINYKIMEIVANHGSDFAYPTQTIHLHKEN